ncbi:MAG: cysteine hydrolase [Clostridia bacterium]|nr:cysteine hydrolase [Clostridia bacterium]
MKKILIVVDMQNDFVDGALGTKEAEAIVGNVCGKINSFQGDIIVTYDTHHDDYMNTQEGKFLPVKHCIKGTSGWQLNEKVQNALAGKNALFIEKPTFGSTELPECVKAIAPDGNAEIELIGLCTDICVVSNALLLKAHFLSAEISVDAACCAGVTPQTHNAALKTMKMCQIIVKGE